MLCCTVTFAGRHREDPDYLILSIVLYVGTCCGSALRQKLAVVASLHNEIAEISLHVALSWLCSGLSKSV